MLDKILFNKHMHLCMIHYKVIEKASVSRDTKFTQLSVVLDLVNLKAKYGWSDKSFTKLLDVLQRMLPNKNMFPKNHYEAKTILCPLGIEYWKIHECINDCILYINEFVEMCKCPKCRVSWYKVKDDDCSNEESTKKDPPTKVCWYLPIIQWFKQLFANGDNTKNLE